MEESLRSLLEQRKLSETEIRTISLDVARALNYLHQKKPEPIIHRDVSSANVLLWRQDDQSDPLCIYFCFLAVGGEVYNTFVKEHPYLHAPQSENNPEPKFP